LAAGLIYVLAIAFIIVLIILIVRVVKEKTPFRERWGMPGKPGVELDDAGSPYFKRESFGPNVSASDIVDPIELSPTKDPIQDGRDDWGPYRLGKSGNRYYMITDAKGQPMRDASGYIFYQRLSAFRGVHGREITVDPLKIDFSKEGAYDDYRDTCVHDIQNLTHERDIRGRVTGSSDPWGWMVSSMKAANEAAPKGGGESFSVAAQDQLLSQKAQGL